MTALGLFVRSFSFHLVVSILFFLTVGVHLSWSRAPSKPDFGFSFGFQSLKRVVLSKYYLPG